MLGNLVMYLEMLFYSHFIHISYLSFVMYQSHKRNDGELVPCKICLILGGYVFTLEHGMLIHKFQFY